MVTEAPAKKLKSKSLSKDKSSKHSAEPTPGPSEEGGEDEEIIRCICGEYEEEEDVERDMICCDRCSAWQHNDCMGLAFPKGEEPDQYYCEQCKPEIHKDLLDRMARGEKPWEEVAERRRKEADEKKSRRRKGKKGGRKGRPSESKTELGTPGPSVKAQTPSSAPSVPPTGPIATPAQEENGHAGDAPSAGTPKRKFDEHQESPQSEVVSRLMSRFNIPNEARLLTASSQGPKTKQQKVSPPTKSATPQDKKGSQAKAVSNGPSSRQGSVADDVLGAPAEISNPARRNVANALVNLFVNQISEAQNQGSFKLPPGKTTKEVSHQLGMSIEHAMYRNICGGSGEPTEPYKSQLRTILFNVKKNTSLRDRLLVGSLLPDALSKMSSQDMASKELQQRDAEIKKEAERQHIIIQEQGPRIRRTHKGEEFIEDDNHNVSSEPIFSTAPTRRAAAEGSPSPDTQHPKTNDSRRASKPQPIDTDGQYPAPTIRSPDGTGHDGDQMFPEVTTHIREPLPGRKIQADADIDHLLRDEEPDSPPYSPKDYHDEGAIWHGKVVMNPIGTFSSSAKHVGGADLSGRIPWSQLIPSTLLINGRIEIQLASNYICGLRFSTSTDVSVVSITAPDNPKERAGFDNLFNYFSDRKRYGVVGDHPLPAVADTYLIPVEAGSAKKPDFLELLENNSLEDHLTERILLVAFVVKTGASNPSSVQPSPHHPGQEAMNTASPLTTAAATPQHTPHLMPGAPAASHIPPTPYGQQQQQQQQQQPGQYNFPGPQNGTPVTGLAAAIQILGPQAHAPAIQQLLHIVPNADTTQLGVVRDILAQQPHAASSYEALTAALNMIHQNGSGSS